MGQHVIITRRAQVADVDLVPHSKGQDVMMVLFSECAKHLDPGGDMLEFEFEDITFSVGSTPKIDPLSQYSVDELAVALRHARRKEREEAETWPSEEAAE